LSSFSGTLTFNAGAAVLAVGCVIPITGPRLASIVAEGERFSEDVHIAAEQGVRLVLEGDNTVRVDAYGERTVYQMRDQPRPVCGIRLIVSGRDVGTAYATEDGRLFIRDDNSIAQDTVLRFMPREGGLTAMIIGGRTNA